MFAIGALIAGCADADVDPTTDPAGASARTVEEQPSDDARPAATTAKARTAIPAAPAAPTFVVASITDGDTLRLRDGRRVRLVQIDTPETHGQRECGGDAAAGALASRVPPGTRVRLVADAATDPIDRYGRLLRYVYVGQLNVNVWLVRTGNAAPYFYDGEQGRFAATLLRDARRAQARGLGIWGRCPNAVLDAYRGVSTGALGHGGANDAAAGAAIVTANIGTEPPYPPDVDCSQLPGPVRVSAGNPHRLDADGDGIGCD
jgi:endonuclease YncB( thermonuclease family)